MAEPLGIQNLFLGTMAGAAIVLAGAFYALLFALGRLRRNAVLTALSLVAYCVLAIAVYVLVISLDLSGFWMSIAATMLVGYFLAPRAIWRLCVGTHAGEEADLNKGAA